MNNQSLNRSARLNAPCPPYLGGWLCSALSVGILLFLLATISTLVATVWREVAASRFEQSLRNNDTGQAEEYLARILNMTTPLDSVLLPSNAPAWKSIDHLSRQSLALYSAVFEGDHSSARRLAETLGTDLFTQTGLLEKSGLSVANRSRIVNELLRRYLGAVTELATIRTRSAEISSQTEQLKTQLGLIQRDLGEIFSIEPAPSVPGAAPAFYTAGVLQDLPPLKDLPDDIADLVMLRDAVERAGGVVRVQGENAQEEFSQKMTTMKAAGRALRAEWDEISIEQADLLPEIEREKTSLLAARASLLSAIRELIIALLETRRMT